MKYLVVIFITCAVALTLSSFTTNQQTIIGIWEAPDLENSTIKVYEAQDGYIYGKIIASNEEDWVGEIILKKVKYDTEDKAWKGEVYSLRRYFTVDAVITLENPDEIKLVGTKYFMSRTFFWSRKE